MTQPPVFHDYYYGNEADQYTFYRLPKVLFTDSRYKNLSDGAKILYGLVLDRMGLSMKNGWLDEQNIVFIFFTLGDVFEKEAIPQGAKPPLPKRAGKAAGRAAGRTATNKIHQKISEVEKDNVGVEAAHKIEQTGEDIYRTQRVIRSALRFVKEIQHSERVHMFTEII